MNKQEIRNRNKQKRKDMSVTEALAKSSVIQSLFLKSELYENANCIMLYMPLENEADTEKIINAALADGKSVVLPVTDAKNKIMPYYAKSGTEFRKGRHSVREPIGTKAADKSNIDIVIVPGIAFDRRGNRVGFGKGCYDGFLKDFDGEKVGICYDFQMCDEIMADDFDVKMDYVITEKGITKV